MFRIQLRPSIDSFLPILRPVPSTDSFPLNSNEVCAMSSKRVHKLDVAVFIIAILLCLLAFFVSTYKNQLFAAGGLLLFYFFLQFADVSLSKSPSAGTICVALADLSPEGKIEFAEEPTDAKAAERCFIKSGQKCVITDFKRGLFTKGIYIVRPVEENAESRH